MRRREEGLPGIEERERPPRGARGKRPGRTRGLDASGIERGGLPGTEPRGFVRGEPDAGKKRERLLRRERALPERVASRRPVAIARERAIHGEGTARRAAKLGEMRAA